MILPALLALLVLSACEWATRSAEAPDQVPHRDLDSVPDPGPRPILPVLIHTGSGLSLFPDEPVTESLYVAGPEADRWTISLAEAPPGTTLEYGLITYRLPEGLDGPQRVSVRAVRDTFMVDTAWTVFTHPTANRPPDLEEIHPPDWALPDQPFLRILHAVDPEGDSLRFEGDLPSGAVLRDGELEWTPALGQAGPNAFRIRAIDTHGHADTIAFTLNVLGFDPWPYTAEPVAGRVWRIRGYISTRDPGLDAPVDSAHFDRTVTLVSRLMENGSIVFRVRDTVSGSRQEVRDTVYSIAFREGFDFEVAGLAGMIPFAWPANATFTESIPFPIGDSAYAARREIKVLPCPADPDGSMEPCGRTTRDFVPGWGLVHAESVRLNAGSSGTAAVREEFTVWDLQDPGSAR